MTKKQTVTAAVFILIVCLSGFRGYAQKPADAVAEVPELVTFHNVIHRIWHEAWPDKNIAMLKDLMPEVEEGISSVVSARLPGIMREKKQAWEEGIEHLKNTGTEYKAAVEADDGTRLIDAAEELHSRFAALMRLTRPVLKELDDFHSSLYMLIHYYLPAYDIEKIRASAEELKEKMPALNAATLPEQIASRNSGFLEARKKLSDSVEAFVKSLGSDREETIKDAIEALHENYQAVQQILN